MRSFWNSKKKHSYPVEIGVMPRNKKDFVWWKLFLRAAGRQRSLMNVWVLGGGVTRCYISRWPPVRLAFLLPFGIGAIRELDEMNSKLSSLEEFSVIIVENGIRGYFWYGLCDIACHAIDDHRSCSPSNGSLLCMMNISVERISVTSH